MAKLVDITKCILNSDVIFKSVSKAIEAVETGNVETVVNTVKSLYPSLADECKKCWGVE